MCFNSTSINKQVIHKILKACNESLSNDSGQAYVNNKHGQPFIRVKRIIKNDGKIGFQIIDKRGINLASTLCVILTSEIQRQQVTGKAFPQSLINFVLLRVACSYEIKGG